MVNKNIIKGFFILFGLLFLFPNPVFAKTYYYQNFGVEIFVNKDSTFDVIERQTYYLDGNFGFFFRDIERKDLDHFSDIKVFDGDGNLIPEGQLDISWKGNRKHIQWNFERRDFEKELNKQPNFKSKNNNLV